MHFRELLPTPKLTWNSRLSSTAGRFCPGSRRLFGQTSAQIEVATYLRDLPDGVMHVRDTVLHEMIHYFLWHQKRPHGHTSEFHQIMKKVGAKRYNTVPKVRPIKHWYECPSCRNRIPARRRMGLSACANCCEKFNRGKYHDQFRLRLVDENSQPATLPNPPKPTANPMAPFVEQRLTPSEVIRRLEELKAMLKKSPSEIRR